MSKQGRGFWMIAMVGLFLLFVTSSAFAEEEKKGGLGEFLRRLFRPVPKSGEMVAHTVENTGEKVLSQSGEELSKGNLPGGLIGQPVKGTAETVGETLSDAGETVASPFTNETEPAASSSSAQQ